MDGASSSELIEDAGPAAISLSPPLLTLATTPQLSNRQYNRGGGEEFRAGRRRREGLNPKRHHLGSFSSPARWHAEIPSGGVWDSTNVPSCLGECWSRGEEKRNAI